MRTYQPHEEVNDMGKRCRHSGMVGVETALLIALVALTGIVAWAQFGAHVTSLGHSEGAAFGATLKTDPAPTGGGLRLEPATGPISVTFGG